MEEFKKKLVIMVIAFVLLTGYAMADIGIDPILEIRGIITSTTIDAVRNFASASEIQWRITDDPDGLPALPDPMVVIPGNLYKSVYTEDTVSNGVGIIGYDKELDI